jgi:hypothetical protein
MAPASPSADCMGVCVDRRTTPWAKPETTPAPEDVLTGLSSAFDVGCGHFRPPLVQPIRRTVRGDPGLANCGGVPILAAGGNRAVKHPTLPPPASPLFSILKPPHRKLAQRSGEGSRNLRVFRPAASHTSSPAAKFQQAPIDSIAEVGPKGRGDRPEAKRHLAATPFGR